MIKKAKNPDFWKKVRTGAEYEIFRTDLLQLYKEFCIGDIPAEKYSEYQLFYQSGNRMEYETGYFAKRTRLNALALLCLIYPDEPAYLSGLEDVIWAICDEYCWALPAHVPLSNGNDTTFIDLFAAETGFALSEIYTLLGGRMAALVGQRIRAEVERRVIHSFLERHSVFEDQCNNWCAVCACGVGAAFLYLRPDLFSQAEPRLNRALSRFLDSFLDDGACREGMSYWSYGFGFYVFYADLIRDFTDGRINLFANEKVEAIASFQHKAFLRENITASYADGSMYNTHILGLTHYLCSVYPGSVKSLPTRYRSNQPMDCADIAGRARWAFEMRSVLWYDPQYEVEETERDAVYYLKESAWYIKKYKRYAFTAKAGDNAEPHNHNDVGGFILATEAGQMICDLGAGEYTRQYFGPPEERYQYLCNRSGGHSVPVIDGKEQSPGLEFKGTMSVAGNTVEIELHKAYDLPQLTSFKRVFALSDDRVVLTDMFAFDGAPLPVTERFITQEAPAVGDGSVQIGNIRLQFDADLWSASVTQQTWSNHIARPENVYLIDLKPKVETGTFMAELIVDQVV